MLIDWLTVFAQIVNFLVLVWLLKRFLYGRVLRAIDARESGIAAQMKEAQERELHAQAQAAQYEAQLAELALQKETLLAQAKADADQQRTSLLEDARTHVQELEKRWREDLERDRQTFLLELRRRASTEILGIVRRVIADLTSSNLEQCAVDVFLHKIRSLDATVWNRFSNGDLTVRSALALSDAQRSEILTAVEASLGRPVRLQCEQSSDVGLGVELRGNGWRIGWNSDAYLQALEEDLNEALNQGAGQAGLP